ncbi:MAG: sodium/proton-translocating pyrophosphatase, partial [Acidobacteria bacterium]|nr:sodium/proton-translocating pyrophosphatase [Acidobacteriota bacterium]
MTTFLSSWLAAVSSWLPALAGRRAADLPPRGGSHENGSQASRFRRRALVALATALFIVLLSASASFAQPPAAHAGGEESLVLPDLGQVEMLGLSGRTLLMLGLLVCAAGALFGFVIFRQLKKLPVHRSMHEISELIYETCKTYLIQQGKFLLILEAFIAVIIVLYFGVLRGLDAIKVAIILIFSLIGIGGSYGVAWFGIRINTFANSRTAFASLRGGPYPLHAIPLKAGMSI